MSFACVYTKQIPLENQQLFRWTVNNNITFHFGSMKRKIELSMLSLGMQFTHFNMVFFFSICVRLLFMFYTCCLICYGYSYVSPKNPPKRLHSDVQACSEFTMAPAAATTMSTANVGRGWFFYKIHLKQKKWNEYGKCGCYDVCVRCYLLPMLFLLLQQPLMLPLPLYMCSFFSLISILRNIYRLYVYINRIDCCMFNPL